MARIRILLVLVLAVSACALATGAAPAAASSAEAHMLARVNKYRARHGLRKVRFSGSLRGSAEKYAHYMMRNGYFGHRSRIQANGSRYHRLGEILELQRGMKARVNNAFKVWMGSSSHRAIIVDRNFTYAGAGRVSGRFRGHKSTIWVMHFGRP